MLNKQINRFTIIIYNNDVGDSPDLGLVLSEQDKCDSGKNQKTKFWYDKKNKIKKPWKNRASFSAWVNYFE